MNLTELQTFFTTTIKSVDYSVPYQVLISTIETALKYNKKENVTNFDFPAVLKSVLDEFFLQNAQGSIINNNYLCWAKFNDQNNGISNVIKQLTQDTETSTKTVLLDRISAAAKAWSLNEAKILAQKIYSGNDNSSTNPNGINGYTNGAYN